MMPLPSPIEDLERDSKVKIGGDCGLQLRPISLLAGFVATKETGACNG